MQQLCDGRVSDSKHLPAIANTLGVDVAWLTTGSQGAAPPWARTPQADPSALATAQADLDRARAANALLAEQLSDALAEVARLRLQVQGTPPPTDATAAPTAPRHHRPRLRLHLPVDAET